MELALDQGSDADNPRSKDQPGTYPSRYPYPAPHVVPGNANHGPSAVGCFVCRSRKVRCDRTQPQCRNCTKLRVRCPGYQPEHQSFSRREIARSTETIFKSSGVEKRRIGSCEQCRLSKSRCCRTRPVCRTCAKRGRECVYPSRDKKDDSDASGLEMVSAGSLGATQSAPGEAAPLDWLYAETLPAEPALRLRLVNAYFEHVHPLKCLAFIHKPTFMRSLGHGSVAQDFGEPLLYAMCALGARHVFYDAESPAVPGARGSSPLPGGLWADKARKDVMAEIHVPTVQNLMTLTLVCEYGLSADQNALVFTLSGLLFRAIQVLGLDAPQGSREQDSAPSLLSRQIEDRVVWSCYAIDIHIASGVGKNSLWHNDLPQIPLPWSDRDFLSQTPSPTHYLTNIESPESMAVIRDFDLPSLSLVSIRLRNNVLSLIRTAPQKETPIWEPRSAFMHLLAQLDAFQANIHDKFRLSDLNMYIHRDQHIMGATFCLQLIYNAAVFDLTRISLAGFSFPLAAAFENALPEFRRQCQERCRFHANAVSELIRHGLTHGRDAFVDPFCADAAFESSKIQIIYTATVANDAATVQVTKDNLATNLQLLKLMHAGKDGQSPHIRLLLPLLKIFGFRDCAEHYRESEGSQQLAEVSGSAGDHHLSNSALFRRARSEIRAHESSRGRRSSQFSPFGFPSSSELPQPQPPILAVQRGTGEQEQPSQAFAFSQQDYPQQTRSLELEIDDNGYNAGNSEAGITSSSLSTDQPSLDDYIRTAYELSDYLIFEGSGLIDLPL